MIAFVQLVQHFNLAILAVGIFITFVSGTIYLKRKTENRSDPTYRSPKKGPHSEQNIQKATQVFRRMQEK